MALNDLYELVQQLDETERRELEADLRKKIESKFSFKKPVYLRFSATNSRYPATVVDIGDRILIARANIQRPTIFEYDENVPGNLLELQASRSLSSGATVEN